MAVSACGKEEGKAPAASVPEVNAAQQRLLWDAEQILIRDCMARQGFKYWPVPQNPVPESRDFPYVLTDRAWAARHGYGSDIQARMDRLRERDPNRRYLDGLPAARRSAAFIAINGVGPRTGTPAAEEELEARVPTGGVVRRSAVSCTSDAQQRLYGDLRAWFRVTRFVSALSSLRVARVAQDPRLVAATRPWSKCMKARGFRYATPAEVRTRLQAAMPVSKKKRQAEVKTAVAEVECAQQTGLTRLALDLDTKEERALAQKYRAEIMTKRSLERQALPRAAKITAAN